MRRSARAAYFENGNFVFTYSKNFCASGQLSFFASSSPAW